MAIMAIGGLEAQYVVAYATLKRSVANSVTLTAAKDRTFSNPA